MPATTIRVGYAGVGRGWYVARTTPTGARCSETVLSRPYTTREAAELAAAEYLAANESRPTPGEENVA